MQSILQARGRSTSLGEPVPLPLSGFAEHGIQVRKGQMTMIGAGPGSGKALDVNTPVPTPTGWTTMGEIKTGDILFEPGGGTTTAFAHSPYYADTWELTFSDGTTVVADGDHLWNTTTRREFDKGLPPVTRRTSEIVASLKRRGGKESAHRIANTRAVTGREADLPIDPYVLGVWLGDGDSRSGRISLGERDADEIIAEFAKRGAAPSLSQYKPGVVWASITVKSAGWSLATALKGLGLIHNKHIPDAYLRGSIQQRTDLLRGLMDSDGCATEKGRVVFTSKRVSLRNGVAELARSLGEAPALNDYAVTLNGKDCGRSWHCGWSPSVLNPFSVGFKASRVCISKSGKAGCRRIVDARMSGRRLVRCLTVDSPTSEYLVTESWIPTHNTALLQSLLHHGGGKGLRPSTLYFSADSGPEVIYERAAALSTRFDMDAIRQMTELGNVGHINAEIAAKHSHIQYDFTSSPTQEHVLRELEAYLELHGDFPDVIVMDNLKDLADDQDADEFRALGDASVFLKDLARVTGSATVALHHVGGPFENGDEPIPIGGLRGRITKDAALILTLHRPSNSEMRVSVVKNRSGRTDPLGKFWVPLSVDLSRMSFTG